MSSRKNTIHVSDCTKTNQFSFLIIIYSQMKLRIYIITLLSIFSFCAKAQNVEQGEVMAILGIGAQEISIIQHQTTENLKCSNQKHREYH